MRYFKWYWAENRGDEYATWGKCTYYFEVDETWYPTRQIEVYESGIVLKYDDAHWSDTYGKLNEKPLDEAEFASYEISKNEFEKIWKSATPFNR